MTAAIQRPENCVIASNTVSWLPLLSWTPWENLSIGYARKFGLGLYHEIYHETISVHMITLSIGPIGMVAFMERRISSLVLS
jgi:hypothetical protein